LISPRVAVNPPRRTNRKNRPNTTDLVPRPDALR
jgi:hypothetical protein